MTPKLKSEFSKKSLLDKVRSNNSKIIKQTIDEYYKKCEPSHFDELLSEFYDEITLKGIRLSEELNIFIQNRLIKTRLFEKFKKEQNDFTQTLERVDFLIFLIGDLNKQKRAPADVFAFISKTIAISLHILKKQLNFSYDSLPWEEIEFCLVTHIADCLANDTTLVSKFLLNRENIINHLINFHDALQNEKSKFAVTKAKFTNRAIIKTNILAKYPKFKGLYEDYEILRDIYSLRRIQYYLSVVLSCEETKMKQFAVERTLQVIGENLKNTPESPNISSDTEKRLLNSAPKHLKKLLTSLRNMLSHSAVLEKKIFCGEDYNKGIINDFKKIYAEVLIILYEKLKFVCKSKNTILDVVDADLNVFLTEEHERLNQIIWKLKLKYPDDVSVYNKFYKLATEKVTKIKQLHSDLKHVDISADFNNLRIIPTEGQQEPLKHFIESCLAFNKVLSDPHEQVLMMVNAVETHLFDSREVKSISDYKDVLDGDNEGVEEKVEMICSLIQKSLTTDKEKQRFLQELHTQRELHYAKLKLLSTDMVSEDDFLDMVKLFPSKIANSLAKMSPQTDMNAIKKAVKSVSDAYGTLLQNLAADTIIPLKNYRNLLNKFCSTLKVKKELILDKLVEAFEKEVEKYFQVRWLQLLEVSCSHELTEDLRIMCVEMLLLDLLEIMMNTYTFVDNTSYLDRASPLLVGKNLRNYLAHGNYLVDIFPFDPRYSMDTHSSLFQEECFNFEEGIDYGHITIFHLEHFTDEYHKRLSIVDNQATMFEAAKAGNLKKVEECVGKGAEPLAFNINGENGLKCAAKANNVELLIYFLNHGANEPVGRLLENAAENGSESIIQYLLEQNPQALEYVRGDNDLLHLAILNNNRSMVTYLLNIGCRPNVRISGISPLHLAVKNGFDIIIESLLNHGASPSIRDDCGNQPLHVAAQFGKWKCAEKLLDWSADVNEINHDHYTPLHLAAQFGHEECINLLLARKAEYNMQTKKGCSPLFLAAMNGHTKSVKVILKHNVKVEKTTKELINPLHAAAAYGHKEVVTLLLENGSSLFSCDQHSWTPLHFAAFKGFAELIEPLFKNGLKTDTGSTALHLAAYNGSERTIAALLHHEKTVIDDVDIFGYTPLYMAAYRGNVNAVDLLIKSGAKIDTLNNKRSTAFLSAVAAGNSAVVSRFLLFTEIPQQELDYALYTAVEFNHEVIVQMLLKASANPNFEIQTECKALEGFAAFQHLQLQYSEYLPVESRCCLVTAAQNGDANIVEALLKNGARIDATAKYEFNRMKEKKYVFGNCLDPSTKAEKISLNEMPCLHYAAIQGHAEVIDVLLKYGAKKDGKDYRDQSALFQAAAHDHKDAVKVLLRAGANIEAANADGLTPLHIAAFRGFMRITQVLVQHNANIHAISKHNTTVLDMAVLGGQRAILALLLKYHFTFEERYIALQTSIIHGKTTVVDVFLKDADVTQYFLSHLKLFPPLHNAVHFGKKEIAKILLEYGFPVNATFSSDQLTPLHMAIQEQDADFVELLLKNGADVNTADAGRKTPLIMAIRKDDVQTTEVLLEHGADPLQGDPHCTPLHAAVVSNFPKMLTLIIGSLITKFDDIRPFVNAEDGDGDTPLMWTIEKKLVARAKTLIDLGADINLQNHLGVSSLHWAVQVQSVEMLQLLLENGVNATLRDSSGKTAMEMALEMNASENETLQTIIGLLLSLQ